MYIYICIYIYLFIYIIYILYYILYIYIILYIIYIYIHYIYILYSIYIYVYIYIYIIIPKIHCTWPRSIDIHVATYEFTLWVLGSPSSSGPKRCDRSRKRSTCPCENRGQSDNEVLEVTRH